MKSGKRGDLRRSPGAFTLIELLVSIVILTLIVLAVAQMTNSTIAVTVGSFKHMDADTQARMVLDRMAYDISKMVKRTDVDYYFNNSTSAQNGGWGSDLMTFFSESSGYYPVASPLILSTSNPNPQSSVSLVGYRIGPTYQLERLSKGLVWNGAGNGTYFPMVYLPGTIADRWPSVLDSDAGSEDADYQIIGDQIFCLKLSYLLQTSSTTVQVYNTPNTAGILAGQVGYFNPLQVQAIIVTIAVLDTNSQKSLANPATQLAAAATELGSALPVPVTTAITPTTAPLNPLPIKLWQAALNQALGSGGDYLGLNKAAASQVRFYQRYCELNQSLQP